MGSTSAKVILNGHKTIALLGQVEVESDCMVHGHCDGRKKARRKGCGHRSQRCHTMAILFLDGHDRRCDRQGTHALRHLAVNRLTRPYSPAYMPMGSQLPPLPPMLGQPVPPTS